MKNIFQLFINIMLFISSSMINFFGMIWFGKLPKVSIYHQQNFEALFKTKEIYEDELIQSTYGVKGETCKRIINDFIRELNNDPEFKNNIYKIDVPIFNGSKIIGTKTLMQVIYDNANKIEKDYTPYKS